MIMKDNTKLQSLSDNELLRRLSELLQNSRRVEADLIGHIAEVDRRRLYARHSPSLFESVAELNPRPDVPPTIRKLPERPSQTKAPPSDRPQLDDRSGPSRTDFERGIRTNRCRSRHTCDGPTGLSADPAGRSKTPISGALQGSTLRAGVAPKPSSSSFTTSSPSGGAATTAPRTSASRAVPITPCLPSATTAQKS